jgi:HEAT repeat protein
MTHDDGLDSPTDQLTHKEAVEKALTDPVARASVARDPRVIERRQFYSESAAELLEELADLGFRVESVGELARMQMKYQVAVPVLLSWLPQATYLPLAEDIVRTLSVNFAKKQALPEFLRLFRCPPEVGDPMRPPTSEPASEHLRWVIGNGLGVFAGPSVADDLIELALDRGFGQARTQIVLALPKTKDVRVGDVLVSLLDDPTVSAFAIEALGKMKFIAAEAPIERLLDHSDKNIRDQAKKALKRLQG